MERLAVAIGVVYNATKDLPCYDISAEYFPCADITGCGSPGPGEMKSTGTLVVC